jgi:RNA polymerase-binding protein DksA
MATQRKPAKKAPAKKAARPGKIVKKAASAKASARGRTASGAPAKSVPAKTVPAKAVAKSAAKPATKPALKPVKGTMAAKAATKGVKIAPKKMPKPPAPVHPIGMLPPESIARGAARPAKPIPLPVRPPASKNDKSSGNSGGKPISAKDYQEFEQRLMSERARVSKEIGHYDSTVLKVNQRDSAGDLSGYSFHMADVGTDAMEREKAFQLASAEGRILLEINEALRRMARGEYGVCESCGNPILRARLEAMPTARLCLACKEKEERAARGIS